MRHLNYPCSHCSFLHARLSLTTAAITALLQSTTASGQCTAEPSEKIIAPDGESGDRFGHALALDGDVLVVGSYRDDDLCPSGVSCNTGSVHVYRRINSRWEHEAKLMPDDAASGDNFGRSVALSGDTLLVGSPLDDDLGGASGSVYVFVHNGGAWTQQAKLTAGDGGSGDTFGDAIALAGDTAVIGALMHDHSGSSNAGAAYVFQRASSSWSMTTKLTADDAQANDNFGNAVAINGDTILVGAENDDDPQAGRNAGSAYVFTNVDGLWTQTDKLTAELMQLDARFGWAVRVLGETAVVSALEEDDRGAVYVFTRGAKNAWSLAQRIQPDSLATFDDFGHALALGQTTLIVGAPGDDRVCGGSPTCDAGAMHLYALSGGQWSATDVITAGDASADDEFGYAVAFSDATIVAGARMQEQLGLDAGAVYGFDADCPVLTCEGDLDYDGVVGIGDLLIIMSAWAAGAESGADLTGDGVVNVFDLLELFALWGPCADTAAERSALAPMAERKRDGRGNPASSVRR